MELCSSGIELLGHEEDTLRVSYDPERGNVKVRIQVAGDQTELSVRDCPRNNFTLRVEVPKSTALYIRMFAGELNVRDVVGDKDVELHFGQLSMDVGKAEDYHRVSASREQRENLMLLRSMSQKADYFDRLLKPARVNIGCTPTWEPAS
jgi:hypothetical protein